MTDSEAPTESRPRPPVLNAAVVDAVLAAVVSAAPERLSELLEPLHAADIADLLEQIGPASRQKLIGLWGRDMDPAVLSELSEGVRDIVMPLLSGDQLQRVAETLETDDVVYLVEDLDEPAQEKVLDALDDADRAAVENSLSYPEFSAGRLMQRELVTAPEHWSVGEMIDFMRASQELPEVFYDVVVTDPRMHPLGTVSLARIMGNRREIALKSLMKEDFHTLSVDQPQEEVAYEFNQYHMVSAPVVDADGRLVGVITIDDAMNVLEDEAEEDMRLLAGVGDEEITDRVWETAKLRFPWLATNLLTAVLASLVISIFQDTLQAIVALAVLMPIVASMGGNAGTQTLTVAVRALATRDLTAANMWRTVLREALVGLGNGLAFAVLIGLVGAIWFGLPMLGIVLGAAMIINLLVAGLAGILIPIGLEKLGADPALSSGTFVTTVTDVVGFFAFLGLAAALLL